MTRAELALLTTAAFVQTYFTDDFGRPLRLSTGQRFVCSKLDEGIFSGTHIGAGVEMARGHGKSMLMKAAVVRAFLRTYYAPSEWGSRYAALLTSGRLYAQFSRDIGSIVTGTGAPLALENGAPLLHRDFWLRPGYLHPNRKQKELQLWNQADKLIYVGNWDHPCRLSVRGMTAGRGDVRGLTQGNQRPDLLIVDDPMKESEADNEEITENVITFVKRSFIPCGSPSAKVAFFGTPFNDKDLITQVCGNARTPPLVAEWPGLVRCALPAIHARTQALLCPQIWTQTGIDERRQLVGSRAFNQEYLLDPSGGGVKHFEPSWIARWTLPAPTDRKRLTRLMYLDPSLGRTAQSDYSAIVILDYDAADQTFWVRLCDMQRRRPQKLVSDYLDLWQAWQPDRHATEDEGAQELLVPIFDTEVKARGLSYQAIPRLQSSGGVPKVQRIKRLSPLMEYGRLRWADDGPHRDLRRQAENWGGTPNETDDALDALEGATRLVSETPAQLREQLAALNTMGGRRR